MSCVQLVEDWLSSLSEDIVMVGMWGCRVTGEIACVWPMTLGECFGCVS